MWIRRRNGVVVGLFLCTITIIFVIPILMGGNSSPLCSVAQAQDSPCLAQEATISALTVELLQAESTITALQDNQGASASTGSETSSMSNALPIEESFSTNTRGWNLRADDDGSVRLSQGRLVLTANDNSAILAAIPEFQAGDEFYIQASVDFITGHFCDSEAGFMIGQETGNYHSFIVGYDCGGGDYVALKENSSYTFSTPNAEHVWHASEPEITLGMESRGGNYTFYINGRETETFPISPYGNELGFVVYYTDDCCGALPTVAFDNLIVIEAK